MSRQNDLTKLHRLTVEHEEQQTAHSKQTRNEMFNYCAIQYGEEEARRMLVAGKLFYAKHHIPVGDSP